MHCISIIRSSLNAMLILQISDHGSSWCFPWHGLCCDSSRLCRGLVSVCQYWGHNMGHLLDNGQPPRNWNRKMKTTREFLFLPAKLGFSWIWLIAFNQTKFGICRMGKNVIANVDLVIGLGIGKPSNWSLQTINGLWFKVEKRKSKNSLVTPSYTTRANLEISFITKDKFCLSFDVLFIFADCFCQYIRFWLRGH